MDILESFYLADQSLQFHRHLLLCLEGLDVHEVPEDHLSLAPLESLQ